MIADLRSNPSGELNAETTELPLGTPSSSVENPSTLGMSEKTVKAPSPKDSQPISNSVEKSPNAVFVRIIQAFAAKLGTLVEWRKIELGDGREVYALCFPLSRWEVDAVSKALKVR